MASATSPPRQLGGKESSPPPIDRRKLFVARPRASILENRQAIINEYNRRYAHIVEHGAFLTSKQPKHSTPLAEYEWQQPFRDAGFTGPSSQRALPADEEAQLKFEELVASGDIEGTDEERRLIWDLETENDGFLEQLREYAEYQREVPVELVNRLIANMEAARFDSVTEEARLRSLWKKDQEYFQRQRRNDAEVAEALRQDARASVLVLFATLKLRKLGMDIHEAWLKDTEPIDAKVDATFKDTYAEAEKHFDAQTEVKEQLEKLQKDNALDAPERPGLELRFKEINGDICESMKTLGNMAYQRYLHLATQLDIRNDDEGEEGIAEEDIRRVRSERVTLLRDSFWRDTSIIAFLTAELKDSMVTWEGTRANVRERRLEQANEERLLSGERVPGYIPRERIAILQGQLDNEQREKFRIMARLRQAEGQIRKLEEINAGVGVASIEDTMKSLKAYRRKVSEMIQLRFTTEASRVDLQDSSFDQLKVRMVAIRNFIPTTVASPPTTERILEVQNAIDEIGIEFSDLGRFIEFMKKTLWDFSQELHSDQKSRDQKWWDDADKVVALQNMDDKIKELADQNENLRLVIDQAGDNGAYAVAKAQSIQRMRAEDLEKRLNEALKKQAECEEAIEDKNMTIQGLSQHHMAKKIDQLERTINNEKTAITVRDYQIERLNKKLDSASQKIVNFEMQNQKREAARAAEGTEDAEHVKPEDIHDLRAKVANLEVLLAEKDSEIKDYENTLRQSLEEHGQVAQKVHESELNAAKQLTNNLSALADMNTDKQRDLEKQVRALEDEKRSLQSALARVKAELEQEQRFPPEDGDAPEEVAKLRRVIEQLERDTQLARKENTKAWEENRKANDRLASNEKEMRRDKADFVFIQSRLSTLTEEHENMRREHTLTKVSLDNAMNKLRHHRPSGPSEAAAALMRIAEANCRLKTGKSEPERQEGDMSEAQPSQMEDKAQLSLSLRQANSVFAQMATDTWDAAPCGEGGTFRTNDGNPDEEQTEVWPEFVSEWLMSNIFLVRRRDIINVMAAKDWTKAEKLLNSLQEWLRRSRLTSLRPWDFCFEYLEIEGSLSMIRAMIGVHIAQGTHQQEAIREDMLRSVVSTVEDVHKKIRNRSREGGETAQEASQWERMGVNVLHIVQTMRTTKPSPARPALPEPVPEPVPGQSNALLPS